MQIVVLIAFVVALSLANQAPLVSSRWLVLPAVVGYLSAAVAVGAFNTALSLRAIARRPNTPPHILRRHNVISIIAQAWLIAGLAGVILLGYGRWVLYDLHLAYVPLIGELAVLAPFVAALVLSWLLEYPFYHAMRVRIAEQQSALGEQVRPGWTLGEYLGYNLRHHLLFIAVPVGLIILAVGILQLLYPYFPERAADYILLAGTIASAAIVFVLAPLLIVRVWRTERLPAGHLRADLERTCRQMHFGCRDLLVWRSGGMITNAGVMGLARRVRYVLLSDALLEHMDELQIKAVFAHEAGHIICHHLFYIMLFAISAVSLAGAAGEAITKGLTWPEWAEQAAVIALLGAFWGLGFGWLSRRFERQSDVIGAWVSAPGGPSPDGRITPEGAAIFAAALERVGQLNGIPRQQRNWRHGSLAGRIAYILWLGSSGGNRRAVDRVVRVIKIGLWLAVLAAGAVVALQILATE